jgi:hypothetical protein
MSIIIGAAVFVVGVCVGGVIVGLLAAGGRDERRVEVADALLLIDVRLHRLADEIDGDPNLSDTVGMCDVAVRNLAELLGYSRSIFDSWKTCDTDVAPVANTGNGTTGSDAPATANTTSGIGVVKAGNYVKQSIASR